MERNARVVLPIVATGQPPNARPTCAESWAVEAPMRLSALGSDGVLFLSMGNGGQAGKFAGSAFEAWGDAALWAMQ